MGVKIAIFKKVVELGRDLGRSGNMSFPWLPFGHFKDAGEKVRFAGSQLDAMGSSAPVLHHLIDFIFGDKPVSNLQGVDQEVVGFTEVVSV